MHNGYYDEPPQRAVLPKPPYTMLCVSNTFYVCKLDMRCTSNKTVMLSPKIVAPVGKEMARYGTDRLCVCTSGDFVAR